MGTNALPVLLRMLGAKDSQFKLRLLAIANRQSLVPVPSPRTRQLHIAAAGALYILGPEAKPAEQELLSLMINGEPQVRAAVQGILIHIDPSNQAKIDFLYTNGYLQ
jgi:hypothetical protein